MRLQTPAWLVCGFAMLLSAGGAFGQGSFQNLGFETASLVPIPGDPYGRVQFAPAFPGWTGLIGVVQSTDALYNNSFLDTSGITILDHGWPVGSLGAGGLISGNFTALLQAGFAGASGTPADTTLSQTGLVPAGAKSLQFKAYDPYDLSPYVPMAVTLGGQRLSLTPLASGANFTLYGADLQAWAGQTAELDFIVFAERPHVNNNYVFLDSIQFSDQPVPEPGVLSLSTLGALLLGWRGLRRRR